MYILYIYIYLIYIPVNKFVNIYITVNISIMYISIYLLLVSTCSSFWSIGPHPLVDY